MEGTVKTQGTQLFLIDRFTSSEPAIVRFVCPTGITGITSGPKDQIDTTCLEVTDDATSVSGLGRPAPSSVPFNMIPAAFSHQSLLDLKESGDVLSWIVCFSESNTPPTLDSNNEFDPPNDRTSLRFKAYIADVSLDLAGNEIVRGTMSLQRSGPVIPTWFAG